MKKKDTKKVLAVIPARGGSKRFPGKNIKPLAGKPLILYSIEDALLAKTVNRVIVSTDSQEIAKIAEDGGAEVPFMRPKDLAGDRVSDMPVIAHAVQWLEENEDYYPDLVVILRPTTPLRADNLVDKCVQKMIDTGCSSVRSVRSVGHWHPYWMLKIVGEDRAIEFLPGKTIDEYYQSQLLPPVFKHDGYCDVVQRKNFPRNCPANATLEGFYGDDRRAVINDVGYFINIDNEEELILAELYLAYLGGEEKI